MPSLNSSHPWIIAAVILQGAISASATVTIDLKDVTDNHNCSVLCKYNFADKRTY